MIHPYDPEFSGNALMNARAEAEFIWRSFCAYATQIASASRIKEYTAMVFALLLLPIAAVLGYINHRQRIRSLEREFKARLADQVSDQISRRVDADRKAEELTTLDRAKNQVLIRMLSDVREPLTMLATPLHAVTQLNGSADSDDDMVERVIHLSNGLQRNIDQIQSVLELDLGSDILDYRTDDLVGVMARLVTSWTSIAERRDVTIHFQSDVSELLMSFDASKIEEAVHNFVERALIDTPTGSTIEIHLATQQPDTDGFGRVTIEISDNGEPIDESYLKVIRAKGDWTSYDGAISNVTALGLALSHRFVESHGGELEIEASGDTGTRVSIVLPVRSGHEKLSVDGLDVATDASRRESHAVSSGLRIEIPGNQEHPDQEQLQHHPEAPDQDMESGLNEVSDKDLNEASDKDLNEASDKETTVLIVDDHPGTRGYLAYSLKKHHNIVEASNGAEALALIKEIDPDLVISDIMMPVMDGNELCRAVKSDASLNHIPVFLVTANAVTALKMEGLQLGADDYLLKPFDLEEAVMRINNEIKTRSELRRRFSRELVIRPSDITVTSADEAFLNRARDIVEENMPDGSFGVQDLASEFALSSRQLQRRLRETVDQSPVEFIRMMRLQRAAQLLEGHFGNVSEVAYSVGFTSLSYFAKCFREQFGLSPSEFKAKEAA